MPASPIVNVLECVSWKIWLNPKQEKSCNTGAREDGLQLDLRFFSSKSSMARCCGKIKNLKYICITQYPR